KFAQEIIPVTVSGRKGDVIVDTDEHPRADTSLERLASLRPVMGRTDPASTVTAGNSSGQNDGASVGTVTHPYRAEELAFRPLATLLREMDRRDARYGLETMCIGGGQGISALFERTP